jgi:hypothetical protein
VDISKNARSGVSTLLAHQLSTSTPTHDAENQLVDENHVQIPVPSFLVLVTFPGVSNFPSHKYALRQAIPFPMVALLVHGP